MLEPVYVTVTYSMEGLEGPGWYVWESEYIDEGYIYFSASEQPTNEILKALSQEYER